jgi:GT2 family glycosyltransferase
MTITKLEDELKEKEEHINFLRLENKLLRAELNQIKMSMMWRVLMNFHYSVIENLLPKGTKRRAWYDNAITGMGRSIDKGDKTSDTGTIPYDPSPDKNELEVQRQTKFSYEPKVSIIVPTFNTKTDYLRDMIESVIKQTYENWELCIADGGSKDPQIKSILESYGSEHRIRIKWLQQNKGISGNSNEAISLASGDYVALLDHDDTLTPSAVFEVVKSINENPRAGFIYSDYAIMDENNGIRQTAFCPDFCRYFYLSHPYIVHLVAIRKEVLDKVSRFDEIEFNSGVSHDVDLFLRIFALLDDQEIVHIPKILYLWRQSPKSAGHLFQDKVHKYTKKAIMRYLHSRKIDGGVEDGLCFNTFRMRIKIEGDPLVSIIIPTKDKWQLLEKCIKSIESKSGYRRYEIIIIKNNTEDRKALEYLNTLKIKYKVVEYSNPFNYSAINNFGKQYAKGDFLLFLNDDIEFKSDDTLGAVVELLKLKEVGAVGAKLIYSDYTIQHAGVIIGLRGVAEHWHKFLPAYHGKSFSEPGYLSSLVSIREYSAVTGAFLLTKRSVFEETGGFSEELKVGFNDVDYCMKIISMGYKILYTPYALAFHYESASRKDPDKRDLLDHPEDREFFRKKWAAQIEAGDPCYNPNLDTFSYIPIPKIR